MTCQQCRENLKKLKCEYKRIKVVKEGILNGDYFDAIDAVLGQWDYFDAIDAVLGHRPAVVIDTLKDVTATEQGLGFDIPDTTDPSSVTSGRT